MLNQQKFFAVMGASILLAGGMAASAAILSRFMVKVQKENTISVKGVASRNITSDQASFSCLTQINSTKLPDGYTVMEQLNQRIYKQLQEAGFSSDELVVNPVQVTKAYQIVDGKITNLFSHYEFLQEIRILSTQVELVQQQSLELNRTLVRDLNRNMLILTITNPTFLVANAEQYKFELLEEATRSAVKRANAIAQQCNGTAGKIIAARQGVIQITRPGSDDSSDCGFYDTTSREKVMRMVVSLEVEIQ